MLKSDSKVTKSLLLWLTFLLAACHLLCIFSSTMLSQMFRCVGGVKISRTSLSCSFCHSLRHVTCPPLQFLPPLFALFWHLGALAGGTDYFGNCISFFFFPPLALKKICCNLAACLLASAVRTIILPSENFGFLFPASILRYFLTLNKKHVHLCLTSESEILPCLPDRNLPKCFRCRFSEHLFVCISLWRKVLSTLAKVVEALFTTVLIYLWYGFAFRVGVSTC